MRANDVRSIQRDLRIAEQQVVHRAEHCRVLIGGAPEHDAIKVSEMTARLLH